jgi:hypothetical protein
MKKKLQFLICSCLLTNIFLIISVDLLAANIYVDKTLSGNITNRSYSISNHNNSGSDGNAYTTIQAAINAMSPGDTIYLRGGTYQQGAIDIPTSKNGTAWTPGNFNTLCSYPGEWAIIDGQNNVGSSTVGTLLGHHIVEFGDSWDLKYWKFERLEICNARSTDGAYAYGFFASGGPFWFTYCYIHDNKATTYVNNPAGIGGYHWQDSYVEYCYFSNNGVTSGAYGNASNILLYSNYQDAEICQNGFNNTSHDRPPVKRNTIRYNYFYGGCVGIRHKTSQFFCGRNPAGGHGLDDTYNTYGDKIHNNIFIGGNMYAIGACQDFAQVYNNIIDSYPTGIYVQYEPRHAQYKVVTYNNTIIGADRAILRYNDTTLTYEPLAYYGYDYNNLFDACNAANDYAQTGNLSVVPSENHGTSFNVSGYFASNNLFYRSNTTRHLTVKRVNYTATQFEAQSETSSPRIAYSKSYDVNNPLYIGTTGAYKYKTKASYILEGISTIANGGIGGNHPYLSNVSIPSYVGAVDPNNSGWVDTVLGLSDINMLKAGGKNIIDNTPPQKPTGVNIILIQ